MHLSLIHIFTANLDAETEERVMKALRRASEGRTVLSVSHQMCIRDRSRAGA